MHSHPLLHAQEPPASNGSPRPRRARLSVLPGGADGRVDVGHAVAGTVRYLVPAPRRPVIHVAPRGGGESRRTASYVPTVVNLHDARVAPEPLSLDVQGFELHRHRSTLADFGDDEQVRRRYYPEMERLLRKATGAGRVLVFDHNVRVDDGGGGPGSRPPVRIVHNDYTAGSAPRRVHDLLPDEADLLLRRRFAVVNAWRPLVGPVQKAPLGLVDARSVAPADLIAADLVYPERTGEILEVVRSEQHRWAWFPLMQPHEVLLIKGYDSALDGRARFTPHTAFDPLGTPADAAPRRSIEVRSLVFFD